MAAVTSLILTKRFTYRGDDTEEFSNRYYLRSAPPGDDASWLVLATDLANAEKAVFHPGIHIVHAYGYNDDAENAHAVFDHDFAGSGAGIAGTYTTNGVLGSGDQAAVVSWHTDEKNARGKWIYLRKYFHGPDLSPTDHDSLEASYVSALVTFAAALSPNEGALHGGIRSRTAAPAITGRGALPYVTTRTLKRRGKRPVPKA
jgi:hypothetical protein